MVLWRLCGAFERTLDGELNDDKMNARDAPVRARVAARASIARRCDAPFRPWARDGRRRAFTLILAMVL